MAFKATRTVVSLDPEDLVRLQEVLMDEDKEAGLAFLREVIGEKVRCAQDQSHKPEFEGGIRPQETHHLSKGMGHPGPKEADQGEAG
jgi:hypothetical protein